MDKKFGDPYKNLPTDPSQELPPFELEFIEGLKKRKQPPALKEAESDSDSESDSESDVEEVSKSTQNGGLMSNLKITLFASILFLLFSNDIVDRAIRTMGLDGMKLLFLKVVLFAIFFFVIQSKFL